MKEKLTVASSGVKADIRQRAAVDAVVCICRVEAPQKVAYMSEMKMSITHRVQLCDEKDTRSMGGCCE